MADSLRLVRGAWPSRCGRNLTRPTLGAPRRALFPVSDGEHCLKVRSDEGPNGPSCGAKQQLGHAVLPIAGEGASIRLNRAR